MLYSIYIYIDDLLINTLHIMKKLFLSFVFILAMSLSFSSSSTASAVDFSGCHEWACEQLGGFEEEYEDMPESEAEGIYQHYLSQCESGG